MFRIVTLHYFISSSLHKTASTTEILNPGQKDLLVCLSLCYCSEHAFIPTFFVNGIKIHSYHEQEILPQQTDKVQDSSEHFCPQVVQVAFKEKTGKTYC